MTTETPHCSQKFLFQVTTFSSSSNLFHNTTYNTQKIPNLFSKFRILTIQTWKFQLKISPFLDDDEAEGGLSPFWLSATTTSCSCLGFVLIFLFIFSSFWTILALSKANLRSRASSARFFWSEIRDVINRDEILVEIRVLVSIWRFDWKGKKTRVLVTVGSGRETRVKKIVRS